MAKIAIPLTVGAAVLVAGALFFLPGRGTNTFTGQPSSAGTSATTSAVPAVAVNAVQRASASRMYSENCANCHGGQGEGGGAGTPSLITRDKFDQKWDKPFFDAIKNGVPNAGMVAYGETFSDEQIWAMVVHIRELQARGLRRAEGGPKADSAGVVKTQRANYRVETVVEEGRGLRTPWGLAWLPDGRMLVTNRDGSLRLFRGGEGVVVSNTPPSVEMGQGGLLDVAVHPNYRQNGWVYLAVNDPGGNGGAITKIVRGKLRFNGDQVQWTDTQDIWKAAPDQYTRAGVHFGSRIVFDGKGHIFFAIGDRGDQDRAQELNRPHGKVFRVKEDGGIPTDNPFVNTPNAIPAIWSYGHRNPQGLVFDTQGRLWDTEHGPRGGDELNEVKKAANYGWPVISFAINYNDSPFRTPWPAAGQNFSMPIFRWIPSIGASGLATYRGSAFPQWQGDLLAGGLAGQNVDRIRVKDGQLVEREEIVHGLGRVRDVKIGPDGFVYLALNNPDKVVRLVPAR